MSSRPRGLETDEVVAGDRNTLNRKFGVGNVSSGKKVQSVTMGVGIEMKKRKRWLEICSLRNWRR